MLRSAAVAWSGPQQEERPLEQEAQPLEQEAQLLEQEAHSDQLQVEGGWSEELQREFEAYQAQTPIGERPLLLVISGRSCLLLLCTFARTLARPCRRMSASGNRNPGWACSVVACHPAPSGSKPLLDCGLLPVHSGEQSHFCACPCFPTVCLRQRVATAPPSQVAAAVGCCRESALALLRSL